MSDVYERLVRLLVANFGFETDEVAPGDTFSNLELDSLALVELALTVQEEFGVDLADDDLGSENTLEQAAEVIASRLVAA
jgi:acyl carrier protein